MDAVVVVVSIDAVNVVDVVDVVDGVAAVQAIDIVVAVFVAVVVVVSIDPVDDVDAMSENANTSGHPQPDPRLSHKSEILSLKVCAESLSISSSKGGGRLRCANMW